MSDAALLAGQAAWVRLRDRERATWDDWMMVADALIVGRAAAMSAAKSNKPMGFLYNRIFGDWLRSHGFDGISNQERYRAILCTENRAAIETWRDTLDPAKVRRLNHPGAVWHAWCRATKPTHGIPSCRWRRRARRHSRGGRRPTRGPDTMQRRSVSSQRSASVTFVPPP